jgi:hypothetical protein
MAEQVGLMRFSSLFQLPLSHRPTAIPEAPAWVEERPASAVASAAPPAHEPPEDLDARVRLVGEWQLDTEWG